MKSQLTSYLDLAQRIWNAPGNQGGRLGALFRSLAWMVNKRFPRRPWTLPVFGNLRFRCHTDSIIALHVVQRSEWFDAEVSRFLQHFLRSGDVFADIGANVGLYTIAGAAWVGPSGRVMAVEPSPANLARLRDNLTLNGNPANVTVHACALADQAGTLEFDDADALARTVTDRSEALGAIIEVPARRFDEIDPGIEITLTKMDVEGYELQVIRGASAALSESRLPIILLEMNHSIERYGIRPEDLFALLRSHGFEIGIYHPQAQTITQSEPLEGDLVAFTKRGRELILQRIPNLQILP